MTVLEEKPGSVLLRSDGIVLHDLNRLDRGYVKFVLVHFRMFRHFSCYIKRRFLRERARGLPCCGVDIAYGDDSLNETGPVANFQKRNFLDSRLLYSQPESVTSLSTKSAIWSIVVVVFGIYYLTA